MESYLRTVQEKTGKTWEEFKGLATEQGLTKHGDIVAWLKSEWGLGHGHANAVTHMIRQEDAPEVSQDDQIAQHFSGGKARWRGAYDDLLATVRAFGPDVTLAPTKSYISFVRSGKKFAIVQPSANRLDIGIKRKGVPAEGRFAEAGSWNPMVTHRVQIEEPAQIDAEVISWVQQAYENA